MSKGLVFFSSVEGGFERNFVVRGVSTVVGIWAIGVSCRVGLRGALSQI